MEEFVADQKLGKKLYRSIHKNFKRWRYGTLLAFVFLLLGIGEAVWVVKKASGAEAGGVFIIAVAGLILPVLFACISFAAAASGGREALGNRIGERVILTDGQIILEYVPRARETTEYDCIQYRIGFDRVTELVYQRRLGRLQIIGDYEIRRYRNHIRGDIPANVNRQAVNGKSFYLYAYYEDFNMLIVSLQKKTGKKVKEEL